MKNSKIKTVKNSKLTVVIKIFPNFDFFICNFQSYSRQGVPNKKDEIKYKIKYKITK